LAGLFWLKHSLNVVVIFSLSKIVKIKF
jgi:hypothetical protein